MKDFVVLKADRREVIGQDWGQLTWYASGKLGNSQDMTLGICRIKPGCANPKHSHPNCVETLYVQQGRVMHTIEGGAETELNQGDTITVAVEQPHQARNISNVDAVLLIAFSSPDRQVKGE
jgi:quercetin dioxygenase-like cupin family protein